MKLRRISAVEAKSHYSHFTLDFGNGVVLQYRRLREAKMCMLDEIRAKRDEIYAIARKHKAEKLWVFGSCARREERPDSDVDFLVKFNENSGGMASVRIRRELAALLNRDVDVVSYGCIENRPQYWFPINVKREMVSV